MSDHRNDPLRELARSTVDFFQRFDVTPQIGDATRNFLEEVDEFVEAAAAGEDKEHIAEEAADVIVTVLGVCQAAGVELEDLIARVYYVAAKNDRKTHATHVHHDGKIRRRTDVSGPR